MLGTSPERQDVSQAPGEIVATVGIDSLEETANNPHVHGEEVQIPSQGNPEDRRADSSESEEHDFEGRGVLSSQTERCRVCMVQLVDVLVQRAVVQGAVEPIVPGVLHNEEDGNVHGHLPERGEGHAVVHAEVSRNGVEKPNLGQLDGEVAQEDQAGALPLFLQGRNFLLQILCQS